VPFGLTLILLISLYVATFFAFFDLEEAAFDETTEYWQGQTAAWGPRPKQLLTLIDPRRKRYFGDEWYFVIYRPFCRIWLRKNGYIEPPPY